jgi:glycosyltransferase involved in cell wall biosynthesis
MNGAETFEAPMRGGVRDPQAASDEVLRAKRKAVVFVTYNGVLDPLGVSQMLSYLERLNRSWRVHILSFERPDKLADAGRVRAMEKRLADQRIGWVHLRYHSRPSLPATTYDMLRGVLALRRLIAREGVGLVHARGYLPMEIASNASRSVPMLFDIRGLQAEEYVDGGVWREGELKWRLAKRSERRFFRRAAGAVVLTQAIRPYVQGRFGELRRASPPIAVIPCCVDLERFRFDAGARAQIRADLGVGDTTIVFVYSGTLGTWYLAKDMARFVRAFAEETGKKVFLLWVVNGDEALARQASAEAGLDPASYAVRSAVPERVPAWLSAGDAGLALIKPCFSKKSSSPTKYAEYLSVGLPIVISRDVGDGAEIERAEGAIALPAALDPVAFRRAAAALASLIPRGRPFFRGVAERLFDVEKVAIPVYLSLYEKLVP